MSGSIRTEDRDGVRVVTIDRPPVNAIDFETICDLGRHLEAAADEGSCRAVVLTGAAPAFSAGLDLKMAPTYDAATRAEMVRSINRAVLALYGLPKPTVAAVNGHTFAAGFVLALACDVRYAAKAAYKLGITEVGAGIPFPACALMVVQAELEPSTARSLSLSGRTFASDDPVTAHFIDTFVAPERLLEAAVAEASAAAGRRAYAAVKAQLRAPLLERMRRCVDDDSDPLARNWF